MRLWSAFTSSARRSERSAPPSTRSSQLIDTPSAVASANRIRSTRARHAYPQALPCTNYFDIYPEDVGPVGHLLIESPEELEMWLPVATPVSEEEVVQAMAPNVTDENEKEKRNEVGDDHFFIFYRPFDQPECAAFYSVCRDAEALYGSAAYLPMLPGSPVTKYCTAMRHYPKVRGVGAARLPDEVTLCQG